MHVGSPAREGTCLQSTTLQLVQAKCLVPANVGWSIRGQGRLWQFLPREAACRRGVGYHDGNSHCAFLTQSPRLPHANRHWCENNYAGANRLQSCAAQHVVQHKGRARTVRRWPLRRRGLRLLIRCPKRKPVSQGPRRGRGIENWNAHRFFMEQRRLA